MTEDLEDRFHEAIAALEVVSHEMKSPDAWREFGDLTLEEFWRNWPGIRGWGEWLWRLVDNERGEKATPAGESDHDELGGGG
jgi:hypothetical protein